MAYVQTRRETPPNEKLGLNARDLVEMHNDSARPSPWRSASAKWKQTFTLFALPYPGDVAQRKECTLLGRFGSRTAHVS